MPCLLRGRCQNFVNCLLRKVSRCVCKAVADCATCCHPSVRLFGQLMHNISSRITPVAAAEAAVDPLRAAVDPLRVAVESGYTAAVDAALNAAAAVSAAADTAAEHTVAEDAAAAAAVDTGAAAAAAVVGTAGTCVHAWSAEGSLLLTS